MQEKLDPTSITSLQSTIHDPDKIEQRKLKKIYRKVEARDKILSNEKKGQIRHEKRKNMGPSAVEASLTKTDYKLQLREE